MPLPIAHALVGATAVTALRTFSPSAHWKPILIGAFLGICPDFDYALNWFRISGGGWHHGFTHSIPFALLLGLIIAIVSREWSARSFVVFSAAAVSHTLLDFLITESHGVALWWPFTDHRYKLRLPNPIEYNWSNSSMWQAGLDLLRISLFELMIFAPVFLMVAFVRKAIERHNLADEA
jgi:membrane-bound metal-dependent hydrolase YbcI (DUF457 family)